MIGRMLCHFFGHPKRREFTHTRWASSDPITTACGRCGVALYSQSVRSLATSVPLPTACRYCGILPGQDLPRPSFQDMVAMLREANDAFDEATGDYPKELVEGEPWRSFRPSSTDSRPSDG